MPRKKKKINDKQPLMVSSQQVADFYDVTQSAVRNWKAKGCPNEGHDCWDLKLVNQWFMDTILESRIDTTDPELAASKRSYWAAKARREKLSADQQEGLLLPLEDVVDQWGARLGVFRNTLLEFSRRLPVRLENRPWYYIADTLKEEACWLLTALSKDDTYCPLEAVPDGYIDAAKFSDDVDKKGAKNEEKT